MEQLLKLVKTYRLTPDLAERFHLAEELLRLIEPDLRLFVFTALCPPAAEDVYQEVLKAVVAALGGFKGASNEEFWGWCYRIARNKLNDHFRKSANDRLQPLPPEELWQLVESSAQTAPLSAADRHDLDYALNLLEQSRPECRDFLWRHYVLGLAYGEIAEERDLAYDAVRMKIGRCLDEAKSLVA